jgi:NADPH:quinone reductase-like Zn-dependent oxidoreductase
VLVTAGSSSAALGGLQLCKDIGARVIAVTSSEKKVDRLLAAGADNVLVRGRQELAPEVLEITNGRGATVIYDPIAGPLASNLLASASPEARYICYGDLNPANTDFSASEALTKRINMKFYSLYDVTRRPELLQQAHEYVYHRLENNTFQPIIDTVFEGLTSAADAHRRMESNAQFGKIVVGL